MMMVLFSNTLKSWVARKCFLLAAAGLTLAEASAALPDHPRILFSESDEANVRARIKQDPLEAELYKEVLRRADLALDLPTCRYHIPDGLRLLGECRLSLNNIIHCGMAWRLSGEKKYFDRVVKELDAACALQDWNTKHFLDTAEMSTAVAIGYDWLYHDLTEGQRERYAKALREKGLEPARKHFQANDKFWTEANNNWAQVCSTGLLFAERALEKEGDELNPGRVAAAKNLDKCREFYKPDGAYPEGTDYWQYGSNYHVLGLALLKSDHKELHVETPAEFKKSALFTEYLTGPSGRVFNFFDAGNSTRKVSPAQSWMVSEFSDQAAAGIIRMRVAEDIKRKPRLKAQGTERFYPLHLLWLPEATKQDQASMPLDSKWNGSQPVATFCTSWSDPEALYVAIKGGYPNASHGQMDIGTFILECDGVRWVEDLGKDNYNLPGYFGSKRWEYYRLTNKAHSTLVIDGQLQNLKAKSCPITDFSSDEKQGIVSMDLSEVYAGQAGSVKRGCSIDRAAEVVYLTDVIDGAEGEVRWAIVTRAKVQVDGKKVLLKQGGKTLEVVREDGEGGAWKVLDAKPGTEIEDQNKGVSLLTFTVPKKEKMVLKVKFRPVR